MGSRDEGKGDECTRLERECCRDGLFVKGWYGLYLILFCLERLTR